MIINYTVTEVGLEDQLLNVVVGFEESELEAQRYQLVKEMSSNRTLLKKFSSSRFFFVCVYLSRLCSPTQ